MRKVLETQEVYLLSQQLKWYQMHAEPFTHQSLESKVCKKSCMTKLFFLKTKFSRNEFFLALVRWWQ